MPSKRSIEQVVGYEVVPLNDSGINTPIHENGIKMICEDLKPRNMLSGNGIQVGTLCPWKSVSISA